MHSRVGPTTKELVSKMLDANVVGFVTPRKPPKGVLEEILAFSLFVETLAILIEPKSDKHWERRSEVQVVRL